MSDLKFKRDFLTDDYFPYTYSIIKRKNNEYTLSFFNGDNGIGVDMTKKDVRKFANAILNFVAEQEAENEKD